MIYVSFILVIETLFELGCRVNFRILFDIKIHKVLYYIPGQRKNNSYVHFLYHQLLRFKHFKSLKELDIKWHIKALFHPCQFYFDTEKCVISCGPHFCHELVKNKIMPNELLVYSMFEMWCQMLQLFQVHLIYIPLKSSNKIMFKTIVRTSNV